MAIGFYIQTAVTVTGSTRKLVTCDGCGQRYQYVATREGWGDSLRPPFFFKERSQIKALQRAKKRLVARLEHAVDPVPCPRCGILQPNMVRPKRREKAKAILLMGGVFVAVILLALYKSLTGHP